MLGGGTLIKQAAGFELTVKACETTVFRAKTC